MELIRRLLVGLLGLIDFVVYNLIDLVYELLMKIANVEPFGEGIFTTFAERIYALLGLFMLFKVSFSLIKYIVNPDEFNDQVKGGKKLVTNILITLVLIVAVPIGFKYLNIFQKALLEDEVIESIVLGTQDIAVDRNSVGKKVQLSIFTAFYAPDDKNCTEEIMKKDSLYSTCQNVMTENAFTHYRKYAGITDDGTNADVYQLIHGEVDGEPLFMHKKVSNEDEYAINYMFIISTLAGGFTAWIFLTFCIDIAIRTVKLGFLQLIAPIPIISYIDPNSSKNGMFSKWLKEVGKTWADLFIRLAAVYFAITLISSIMQNGIAEGDSGVLTKIFIILGILIFAGQIPKLIGDLLGMKIDGNFSLNPMSKINSSPIAGAAVGGIAGGALGFASNAATMPKRIQDSLKDWKSERDQTDENGNRLGWKGALTGGNHLFKVDEHGNRTFDFQGARGAASSVMRHTKGAAQRAVSPVGAPLAGGVSAMVRGAMGGAKGKGSALGAGFKGAEASSRSRNAGDGGYGVYDRFLDGWTDVAGVRAKSGTTKRLDDQIKQNQLRIANYKGEEQALRQQMAQLRNNNPQAYIQAFRENTVMKNGKPVIDDYGNVVTELAYKNYDEYFVGAMAEKNIALNDADVDALIQGGQFEDTEAGRIQARRQVMKDRFEQEVINQARAHYTDDEAGRALARQDLYALNASANGILEQRDYDAYESVRKERQRYDIEASKLEKENKKLQGYKEARNGKPRE